MSSNSPMTNAEWVAMAAAVKAQHGKEDVSEQLHWEKHGFPEGICPWCQFERGEIPGWLAAKIAEDLNRPISFNLNFAAQPVYKPGERPAFIW